MAKLLVAKSIIQILLHILILGLIPLGLFCINISEIPTIILAVLWIAALWAARIIWDKKRPTKHRKFFWAGNIGLVVLDAAILFLVILSTLYNPYWNGVIFRKEIKWGEPNSGNAILTKDEALEDYAFAMKYLKKVHPIAENGLPSEVMAQADVVKKHLESIDTIQGYELSKELESIFARIHDGHTLVHFKFAERHIMKHMYEHDKKKDTLVGINGMSFKERLQQNPYLCSYEMESFGIHIMQTLAFIKEYLKYYDIDTSGNITYNYITADNTQDNVTVTEKDFLIKEEYLKYEESVTGDDLHKEETENNHFVSYEIDAQRSLAILKLDACIYNAHYKKTLAEMFEKVHELGIQNVAVDLRENSGGQSIVANEFINYLGIETYKEPTDEIRKDFKVFSTIFESLISFLIGGESASDLDVKKGYGFSGNVYVLTSVSTFSSAMDFTMMIQDNKIGKVIGEPPGNMPTHYGDVSLFNLPNSGLTMSVSYKTWHRIDTTKDALPLIPDIECDARDALDRLKTLIDENQNGK